MFAMVVLGAEEGVEEGVRKGRTAAQMLFIETKS